MRNVIIICYFIWAFALNANAQNESSIWVFGSPQWNSDFNLDFRAGLYHLDSVNRNMSLRLANSSICDQDGTLLFYTNGVYVADVLNDTMQNGSGLNAGVFASGWASLGLPLVQPVVTLNDPANDHEFYLIHLTIDSHYLATSERLMFTKVDMDLAGGLGAVTTKNQAIFQDTLIPGDLQAVKHGNGRDWWVVSHQNHSDLFHLILITPFGILGPYDQHIGTINDWGWQAKFSPDGSKYATYENNNGLQLLEFDRCSGVFFNARSHIFLNDTIGAGGVSFSPDSKLLYISCNDYLVQLNTDSLSLKAGMDTVAVWDGFISNGLKAGFGLSELGPDDKIYIVPSYGAQTFHVVESPNYLGVNCNVLQHAILTPGAVHTPPSFPNFSLGPLVGSVCDSIINSVVEIDQHLFALYPNPTTGISKIHSSSGSFQEAQIYIYNTVGQIIYSDIIQSGTFEYFIDFRNYVNGVYLMQIVDNGKVNTLKLVKM